MAEAEGALPLVEPWSVLSGPDNAIWDEIFDWIANAIKTIVSSVTRALNDVFS